ncbi:hypothetical protein ACQPZJ_28170 [Actinoplanes sp. CA-054009]
MRAILFISLDGVAVDAVVGEGKTDTLLIGRKTYDSFAGAWPESELAGGDDAAFAKHFGDCRKVVVSRPPSPCAAVGVSSRRASGACRSPSALHRLSGRAFSIWCTA